jgi:osmoprotectant transport system substrate-binding protein
MKRTTTLIAGMAASLLLLAACGGGGGNPLGPSSGGGGQPTPDTFKIASQDFPESRVLAEIYAQVLEAKGKKVERHYGIGSREIYFPGFKDGSYNLVPDYSGTLLQFINKDAKETTSEDVYKALKAQVPDPLTVLDQAQAQDKDAVVVTKAVADKYGTSLDKFGPACGELVFGGPSEFETRPDGTPGLEKNYGCKFKEFRSLDSGGPLTVAALKDGTVQAADLFTTDPQITANGFVVLDDPKSNFAAQNVVPLIHKANATPDVVAALNGVSAKLTTQGLIELNTKLNEKNATVETVAKGWLVTQGLA